MKRRVCVLLTCLLLLAVFTVTVAAAEPQNSFVLTVSTANNMVIEPERIPYTSGQTIKEALLASGHTFAQLEEQGFIGAVDDVAANYVILYDGGGYDVNAQASSIKAMRIGVTTVKEENWDSMLSLVKRMAEYRYMENHVQNYPDAQSAYKICLNALRGDGSAAAAGQEKLDSAIAVYEAILAGPKYMVSVSATQGGETVAAPVFTLTDTYGNVTSATGTSLQVIAGDYTFCVSDGTYNRTEGSVKIREGLNFSVELPTGEWFDDIYIRQYSAWTGYSDAYRSERDSSNHKLTVWIDDTASDLYGADLVCYQGTDIPDKQQTLLRSVYVSTKGQDMSDRHITWSSKDSTTVWGTFLPDLVNEGLDGRTFSLEARYTNTAGHVQIQSFEIDVQRAPTLKMLAVYADGTRLRIGAECYSIGSDGQYNNPLPVDKYFKHKWEYTAATTSDTLEITAEAFGDYAITGLGTIQVTSDKFDHVITVTAQDGKVSAYKLHVEKDSGVSVTLSLPAGTTGQVFSDMDSEIMQLSDGSYRLLPDREYYYIATKNTYYHTKATFTARAGLQVAVAEPIVEDWLDNLGVYSARKYGQSGDSGWNANWTEYEANKHFSSGEHNYTYVAASTQHTLYLQATTNKGQAVAHYCGQSIARPYTETLTIQNTVGEKNADQAIAFLQDSGYGIPMTIQVEATSEDGTLYYQEYTLSFVRQLKLYSLTATAGRNTVVFETEAGEKTEFDRDILNYVVTVDRDAESVTLSGEYILTGNAGRQEYWGGFYSTINGQRYDETLEYYDTEGLEGHYKSDSFTTVTIPLNAEENEEVVTIEVCHADSTAIPATYTLEVKKSSPVPVNIKGTPGDLLVFMTSDLTGRREYEDTSGVFMLTPGRTYSYNATCYGYVGQTGSFTVPQGGGDLEITLVQAPANTSIKDLPSEWPHLRTDNNNNGVINAPTPISSDDAVLYWATKIGEGFDQDACSPPIIVNDELYVYSGSTLYRIDKTTGKILAQGEMSGTSNFAINPPTYADGMIFVGLSGGTIQAFNASTLESLWVYTDPLGGQPNCSIVYHDGYVYTGFWSGEDRINNYVCLTATDEDPSSTLESKIARWTYSSRGGFYWSGAYVCDQFTLIGTDDGEVGYTTGYAHLLSLDTSTGKLISDVTMDVTGDIRSSITHYNGKYYYTSKGGYFFEATVSESGEIQAIKEMRLYNYSDSASNPPMSTSTPTIYNGRAYIGVSGTGQFTAYSGHNITVIDIPNWEIAYTVQTQGYPQTSGVLTTAYEQETGKVYVYFFDNFTPGKLRALEDSTGQISTELTSDEYGITTALNLFEPSGDHAQYAICSPVVDSNGTIYFKNDSAYLMAVGSTVDTLEVTQPTKLNYNVGETFNPTGLQVIAHFKNGTQKDVTEYMTWSMEPLTEADTDFQLLYPVGIYQNKDGEAGQAYQNPVYSLALTIQKAEPEVTYGDVNGDGKINMQDYILTFQYCVKRTTLSGTELLAADVNGDNKVNMQDYILIFSYCVKRISAFPVQGSN